MLPTNLLTTGGQSFVFANFRSFISAHRRRLWAVAAFNVKPTRVNHPQVSTIPELGMVHYCGSPPYPRCSSDFTRIYLVQGFSVASNALSAEPWRGRWQVGKRFQTAAEASATRSIIGASGRFWFAPAKILVQVIVWFVVSPKRSFLIIFAR